MYPFETKIGFTNERQRAHIIAIEPWANDYTLLPGETLEVFAYGNTATPRFDIVEWEDTSQVYCNETVDFKVMQGGVELACGHNRQTPQA